MPGLHATNGHSTESRHGKEHHHLIQVYILATHLVYLLHLHAAKSNVALQKGIHPATLSSGLTVMLEKECNVSLINELWTILLMEADFNATNKVLYRV